AIRTPPKRLRIALCTTNFEGRPIHAECREAAEKAAKLCADLGHEIVEARPDFDFMAAMRAWANVVAVGTALSVQSKVDAIGRPPRRDELEPIIYSAWEQGLKIPGTTYLAGINMVHAVGRKIAGFFENYDMLLTPVLTEPPAVIGR